MKRMTEQHYKKTDGYYMKCSEHCCKEDFSCEDCEKFDDGYLFSRLYPSNYCPNCGARMDKEDEHEVG